MKLVEFVFAGEGDIGDIAASAGFAGETFAKIVDNHVMKPRSSDNVLVKQGFSGKNPIEDLDHIQDANLEIGFLEQLASNTLL